MFCNSRMATVGKSAAGAVQGVSSRCPATLVPVPGPPRAFLVFNCPGLRYRHPLCRRLQGCCSPAAASAERGATAGG